MAGKWRQMSDSPGDWGFDEYITDPTAGGWYWETEYTRDGRTVTHPEEIYFPDLTTDFAIDFMRRHRDEPFYFYLSQHLIHGPILRTPDSEPDAAPHRWYDDNLVHLDEVVGRVVAALEELGLRETTLILFSADNGTSTVGYRPEHDPSRMSGKIGGRSIHGTKGQLLEGGSRVPLIASWPGTTAAGQVRDDLIDFSDLLPTFAELAGAELPGGVTFDGRSFAPQLRGEAGNSRAWIFVQLGRGWYVRDDGWKLNERGELFSMQDAPFVEAPIAAGTTDPAARAARARLQAVLDELNPAGGKVEPVRDAAKKAQAKRKAQTKQKQAGKPD
jgi:arylsulfatase A-like enzyme